MVYWKVRFRISGQNVQAWYVYADTVGEAINKAIEEAGVDSFKSIVSASVVK